MTTGYRAAERMLVIRPKGGTSGRPAVFYAHGFALTSGTIFDSYVGGTQAGDELNALAEIGFPVFIPELDGNSTWGRDGSWQALDQAISWAGSNYGINTGAVALAGESMGGLTVLNNAHRTPGRVRAVALRVPVVNLAAFRTRNNGTFGGLIDTAYGSNAAYLAALPTNDPSASALVANARATFGPRTLLHYTTLDEVIPPSEVSTYGVAIGATVAGFPGNHAAGFDIPHQPFAEWIAQRLA